MNYDDQKKQAVKRQKLLESKYSKEELKKVQEFNPKLAKSFLISAALRESTIKPLRSNTKKPKRKTFGYIYILKNSFSPSLIKIGCSYRDPIKLCLELSDFIGIPGQFEVLFSWRILNACIIEKKLHS
jgi:hypothetical protein